MMISVIIPAYNAGKHIGKALDSVLCQSFSDFEIVVVNDGSTDNTAEIVEGYSDSRVRMISQENGGTMSARKTGVENVAGEYVLFCDADDLMHPDALQNLYSAAVENKADIVIGKVRILREDGSDTGRSFEHELPYGNDVKGTVRALWEGKLSHNLAGTLLKSTLFSMPLHSFKGLSNGEDACYMYQLAVRSDVTVLVQDVVYDYFVRSNSVSHRKFNDKMLQDIFTANVFCYSIASRFLEQKKARNTKLIQAVRKGVHEFYPYRKLRRILKDNDYMRFVPVSVRLECMLKSLKKKVVKRPFSEFFPKLKDYRAHN